MALIWKWKLQDLTKSICFRKCHFSQKSSLYLSSQIKVAIFGQKFTIFGLKVTISGQNFGQVTNSEKIQSFCHVNQRFIHDQKSSIEQAVRYFEIKKRFLRWLFPFKHKIKILRFESSCPKHIFVKLYSFEKC